jgi:hypothetical protein
MALMRLWRVFLRLFQRAKRLRMLCSLLQGTSLYAQKGQEFKRLFTPSSRACKMFDSAGEVCYLAGENE